MELQPEYIGQTLLKLGFEAFFRYLFRVIEGRPFIMEPIHPDLFNVFEDIYNLKRLRQTINIFPRSSKTTLCKYFIVYSWCKNPKCNFIYTSYSQSLLNDIARDIQNIMEHPAFKAMFPVKATVEDERQDFVDDFWRQYWNKTENRQNVYTSKKIVTYAGGSCLFSSIGSQLTGFGCFDYDTLVYTENGKRKIGDIVENKEDIKIWSWNREKKQAQLTRIYKYIKNDNDVFLKITLENREHIICSKNHRLILSDGTELAAFAVKPESHISSYSFNNTNRYIKFLSNIFSRIVFITNKIYIFSSKFFKKIIHISSVSISSVSVVLRYFSPNKTTFNICNTIKTNVKFFGNLFIWTSIFCYLYGLFCGEFLKFSIMEKFIVCVFLSSAIFKIFKTIIISFIVYMPSLFRTFTNKCFKNKTMNKKVSFLSVYNKINSFISFICRSLFHYFFRFIGKYLPVFCYKIPVAIRNLKILNIENLNHSAPSYCVTLWDNNNLFIGESQVLVGNCGIRGAKEFSGCLILDDFDKPADIGSEVIRAKTKRYYTETLLSRLNDSNVPILNVQQRLHVDDISGFLKDKYGFEVLKKPLLNIRGECQAPSQYDEKRLKELQFDKSAFSAQYQQEPTLEEGNLIKRDWWQYYKPEETPVEGVLIITADTAYKKSKTADFSCLQCWELKTGRLLMRDMIVDKWEFPELLENAKMFWDKWTRPEMIIRAKYFFIEDKASGISLVQTLEDLGINTVAWKPKDFDFPDDKVGRTKEFSWAVFSGLVFLPENNKMSEYLVEEAAAFKEDMSHFHDDASDAANMSFSIWRYYGGMRDTEQQ
jgi:predicted phage terminase large subunit-like protein